MKTDAKFNRNLPETLESCHAVILDILSKREAESRHYHSAIQTRDEELKRLSIFVEQLQHQLEKHIRHRFGKRSEKFDNLPFLFPEMADGVAMDDDPASNDESGDESIAIVESKPRKRKKKSGRQPLSDRFDRVEILHDLDDDEKFCAKCGKDFVKIGEAIHEQLDYIRASFRVLRHVTMKYACPNKCGVMTAMKPALPIEKGIASPGLLAKIIEDKYEYHQPINRQLGNWKSLGWDTNESTLCSLTAQCADTLEPVVDAMVETVVNADLVHVDETPFTTIVKTKPGSKKKRTSQKAYMWVYVDPLENIAIYDPHNDRTHERPLNFLESFSGYLISDGYSGYNEICRRPDILAVGCWMHVRRKFVEYQSASPERLDVLSLIKEMYCIERTAKETAGAAYDAWLNDHPDASMDEQLIRRESIRLETILRYRQSESLPIVARLYKLFRGIRDSFRPKHPLRAAAQYALNRGEDLGIFLFDPKVPPDNGEVERQIRPFAVGRKNWMFTGGPGGSRTAAIMFSIMTTCKMNHVPVYEYLKDVLTRLPQEFAKVAQDDIAARKEIARRFMPTVWQPITTD